MMGTAFSTRKRPPNSFTKNSNAFEPYFNFVSWHLIGNSPKHQFEQIPSECFRIKIYFLSPRKVH